VDDRDWPEDQRDVVTRLLARAHDAQWREVLLLAVSQLILHGQARAVAELVGELVAEHGKDTGVGPRNLVVAGAWARNVVVAGEILTQAERKLFDGLGKGQRWDAVVEALRFVMRPSAESSRLVRVARKLVPLVSVPDRVRAGMALSLLGDPRLGIGSLALAWCEVPAGPFLLGCRPKDEGAYENEQPQRTVDLLDFRIARYPVTNTQWRAFLEAAGYQERRWWSDAGWRAKEAKGWTQPAYWDDPRRNGANQPVVGVSWYEATAFCRWLSAELGYAVRLPSEAEWEKAARGTDGRIYPWGDDWDAAKANTSESGIGTTTPVGCFPDGASPYGALDMSGNVYEWTATPWTSNYQQSDGTARETEDGPPFVWRGGAWFDSRGLARCASRLRHRPSSRDLYLGVRVVAALTPSE
jgi:formylglycine-generating enzyme required for sulfatase activity